MPKVRVTCNLSGLFSTPFQPCIALPGLAKARHPHDKIVAYLEIWSPFVVRTLYVCLLILASAVAKPLSAQDLAAPASPAGHITGTVTDGNGDMLSGATVILRGPGAGDAKKM